MTMPSIQPAWSQDYSLGIEEIDEQHRIVFEQIDALRAGIVCGETRREIAGRIEQLIEYTRVHLVMEESTMRLLAYADYAAHKRLHDAALIEMDVYAQRHHAGETLVAEAFLAYAENWWRQHILDGDARYVRSLTGGNGVSKRWLPDLGGLLRRRRKAGGHHNLPGV